jgi:hypothetical protein
MIWLMALMLMGYSFGDAGSFTLVPGLSFSQRSFLSPKQVHLSVHLTSHFAHETNQPLVSFVYFQIYFYSDIGSSVGSSEAKFRIIYVVLTVATNLLTTSLIVYRIIRVTGLAEAKTYRGLIGILVESSLLFSLTHLIYLGVYIHAVYDVNMDISDTFPAALLPAVTVSTQSVIIVS